MSTTHPIVEAWSAWVAAAPSAVVRTHRKMIVQVINAQRLAYTWHGYDKALANMRWMFTIPAECPNAIAESAAVAATYEWSAESLQRVLR